MGVGGGLRECAAVGRRLGQWLTPTATGAIRRLPSDVFDRPNA